MTTPFAKQINTATIEEMERRIGNNLRSSRPVLIGNPTQEQQIYTDDTQTQIFVHSQGDTTQGVERISASGIPNAVLTYKRAIRIRKNDSDVFEYAGVDVQYDEVYSQGTAAAIDQTPVKISQLSYATLHPQSGLILLVKGAMYGDDLVRDLLTPDFSSGTVQDVDSVNITIPTTNRRAKGILVQLDAETSALSYKQSAEYNSSISLRDAYDNDLLPLRDAGRKRVGYFELINGMTELTYDNLLIVPEFLADTVLWPNPIVEEIKIQAGRQQHAINQTISTNGLLTVSGEYYVDNQITISGGQLIIADGGQMIVQSIITDQPSLLAKSIEKTADYTVLLSDGSIIVDASGGVVTITLPPVASATGRSFRIGRSNSGGGNVIIEGDGSETINGNLNETLSSQWSNVIVVAYDTPSTDWSIG